MAVPTPDAANSAMLDIFALSLSMPFMVLSQYVAVQAGNL
jgi:hypothetical protein